MKMTQAGGLPIWLNDVDSHNRLSISLNIGGGFASEWMGRPGEAIRIGSASAKLYTNYLKRVLNENGFPRLKTAVSMYASSFLWQTGEAECTAEIQQVLDLAFQGVLDEALFEDEKQQTIKRFKACYKELAFRGHMRMLEFAHHRSLYRFKQLMKDLEKVSLDQMADFRKHVIHPKNMFLFVHGKADAGFAEQLQLPRIPMEPVQPLFKTDTGAFLQDAVFEEPAKRDWQCGAIRFERDADIRSLTKEYAVLTLVADMLFPGKAQADVSLTDASLIYMRQPLQTYKYDIRDAINETALEKAKERVLNRLDRQLSQHPLAFAEWVGRLYMQDIHAYEWRQLIETLTAEQMIGWMDEADYQVREGYVKYRKEELAYGK